MKFVYPQMIPNGLFIPFMPTYWLPPPVNPFQALQYNAILVQPGNEVFVMPHVPPLKPQLDAGQHQDRAHQPERGQHKTAASATNHHIHASFGTITNDHRSISHHRRVGNLNNARSGSAGRPPSLGMPNHRSGSRAALQNRSGRASATRGQRKCDDLLQYVVAIDGTECNVTITSILYQLIHFAAERPWKRRRRGSDSTASIASMSPMSVMSTLADDDDTEAAAFIQGTHHIDV